MTAQRGRPVGPPSSLSAEDYDILDDAEFRDFIDWDKRRHGGQYHLGDYSVREVMSRLRWIKGYCIALRQRLRESKSASHIRGLEAEVRHLTSRMAQLESAPDTDRVRRLRVHVSRLETEMRKSGMTVPQMSEWDG